METVCHKCGIPLAAHDAACSRCSPTATPAVPLEFDFSASPPPPPAFLYPVWTPPAPVSRWQELKIAIGIAACCLVLFAFIGLRMYSISGRAFYGGLDSNTPKMDRQQYGRNGMLRLEGPSVKGGPTFGESKWADLEIVDFGWNFYGSLERSHRISKPFVKLKNKSQRVWEDVRVLLVLTDREGRQTKAEIPVGRIIPGHFHNGEGEAVDRSVKYSSVVGMTGKPASASAHKSNPL